MYIITVGLNYKTAPVEIREKLAFTESILPEAMLALNDKNSILENMIVSTCNRTEVYAVVNQLYSGKYDVKQFLAEWFGFAVSEIEDYLYIHEEKMALEHILKVTCGLNSMILGETQILGQVRSSFLMAQENQTIGTVLQHFIRQALTLAKKAHSETDIGANAVSVSYAAVELAKKIFGSLDHKHVLVVGAGKMGELAIENLYANGTTNVTVMNRTFEKAETLAQKFNGAAKSLQELQCAMIDADIVISSTGANGYVISKEMLHDLRKLRKGRPLFLMDIAVPRDVDPQVDDLDYVFLYDIDDLEGIVQANLAERQKAADEIMVMIGAEIAEFKQWLKLQSVTPVIASLREKALKIQEETMDSIENKMPNLTAREKKLLNKHTKSIINQLIKDPILQVKEFADDQEAAEKIELFKQIFGLEEQPSNKVEQINKKNIKVTNPMKMTSSYSVN